jgi:hypothetical protein
MYREAYRETPVRLKSRAKAETLGELIGNLKGELEERLSHSNHEPFITLLEIHDKEESRRYAVSIAKRMKADDEHRAKAVEKAKADEADEWKRKRMMKNPPSEKQIAALKRLGVKVLPLNSWDASCILDEKIGRLKKNAVMAG